MWFPMKKGQQNGGILPEKREGYLKAVEFIIRRLMNFPDNQTRKIGVRTVAATPSLLAQPNGVRFFGEQGLACPKRRSRKLRANPISLCARKTARSEGSLAKPNLQPQSPFFCFLFFGEAKKRKCLRRHEAQRRAGRKWQRLPEIW
ncbi:hypothetical protein A7P96_02535 [Eikenella sp. NML03-A-027]|uniref:hypothetical protein n=1 Tax=Eikenella sp. NML03-A-027 TaxID=1795828 RepID=UPI0007DFE171|nr:hypothetical protein [Eikenella sp. NML03-A-027]OAM32513.1 hypothetical protein A7P96_02535 [Eikenella sp. NML03-A-027]